MQFSSPCRSFSNKLQPWKSELVLSWDVPLQLGRLLTLNLWISLQQSQKKTVLSCLTPPHIIPRVSSLKPGRSQWPLLCDWINPQAWDNGHVMATGRMWQENNQPTAVPFQSSRQWSLLHRRGGKNMLPHSFQYAWNKRQRLQAV